MDHPQQHDDTRRRSRTPEQQQQQKPCWLQASSKIPPMYRLLGIDDETKLGISESEINQRYKKLALLFHPDRIQHHPSLQNISPEEKPAALDELKEQFQKIKEAHTILGNEKSRAEYDTKFGINRHLRVGILLQNSNYSQQQQKNNATTEKIIDDQNKNDDDER